MAKNGHSPRGNHQLGHESPGLKIKHIFTLNGRRNIICISDSEVDKLCVHVLRHKNLSLFSSLRLWLLMLLSGSHYYSPKQDDHKEECNDRGMWHHIRKKAQLVYCLMVGYFMHIFVLVGKARTGEGVRSQTLHELLKAQWFCSSLRSQNIPCLSCGQSFPPQKRSAKESRSVAVKRKPSIFCTTIKDNGRH